MKCGNMWESCLFCLRGVEIVFERGRKSSFCVSNLGGELVCIFFICFSLFILFYLYFPHMRLCVFLVFQEYTG